MDRKIRVMCVDDNRDVADALRALINAEPKMTCVGCAASVSELLEQIDGAAPDVVVLDARMPGDDPIACIERLRREHRGVSAVVFSGWIEKQLEDRATAAGAAACVDKCDEPGVLMRAIRGAAAGGRGP